MLTQAFDYREECDILSALLEKLPEADWNRPTQFKRWTSNDVVGHLHMFDHAARLTLEGPVAVKAFFAEIAAGRARGETLGSYTRRWLGNAEGGALLRRWRNLSHEIAALYADQDPRRRVAWGGPDMSVRSCISARQMETWAHGQAIFDLFGRMRPEGARLKNIAVMGVNTFGWTFSNRGEAVPAVKPYVRLIGPRGETWEWNEPQAAERIEGPAVDFCMTVTQTRNVRDTGLVVSGEIAGRWMSHAQCFAGPPEDPPAPGTRHPQ